MPENGSGETADTALALGNQNGSTYDTSDWVGWDLDKYDCYEFTLSELSSFDLTLSGLANDANVSLMFTGRRHFKH